MSGESGTHLFPEQEPYKELQRRRPTKMKLFTVLTTVALSASSASALKSGFLFTELETAQVMNEVGSDLRSLVGGVLGCKTEHKIDDAEW